MTAATRPSRELCIMACVFCRDPVFQAWLHAMAPDLGDVTEEMAKAFIIEACDVTSRNELDTNYDAALRFHALVREPFIRWKEAQAIVRAAAEIGRTLP